MKKGITPAALGAAMNGNLENFVAASTPGGIEAQEARGQQTFVKNETLPKEMHSPKESFESLGIKFGEDVDDVFVNVILPEGWEKKPTDHSMWSDLVDNRGRKRASIFYKAAFYDRSAHISLSRRYRATYEPEDGYKSDISSEERNEGNWYGVVYDCDEVIHKTDPIKGGGWKVSEELSEKAKYWLLNQYPDYENELAYWD